jgi:hypothetical protein
MDIDKIKIINPDESFDLGVSNINVNSTELQFQLRNEMNRVEQLKQTNEEVARRQDMDNQLKNSIIRENKREINDLKNRIKETHKQIIFIGRQRQNLVNFIKLHSSH